jgi:triacylglycerol esterase/lipase EstA (alpha/beta hydrolase family)
MPSRKSNQNANEKNIYVIYIGGFLVPRNRMPFDESLQIPSHVKVICVYPSGVSSLHDRVMQIFYELKGGSVHYGEKHSRFHGHDSLGIHFEQGTYPQWDENHPIHVIGHSFGGLTARVLQYYLSLGNMFHGYTTNSKWIISVTTVNSPLNGALRTYSYGAHLFAPPLVRLASLGYWIGVFAHLFEFLDLDIIRSIYDFQLSYWQLSWKLPGSFRKHWICRMNK